MTGTVATWGGAEIQLVSDEVVSGIEAAKSFLSQVNEALSIALEVSNIAKTFVTSNLNLARALINGIIDQLRSFIRELYSLGVYANFGDIRLLREGGTAALYGGYPAYERRMLAQLNNRNDPNRPDFTQSSTVLGLFFYVGVDISFVNDLIDTERFAPIRQLIRAFAALFGISLGGNNTLPLAINLRSEYSSPNQNTSQDFSLALSSLLGKTRYQIVWNSAPVPNEKDPQPTAPASGFIVEVSCYPNGFGAAWIGPDPSGTGRDGNQSYTTGMYQAGDSGQSLVIFGGEDAINLDPSVLWPSGFTSGSNLPDGSHPLYFYRDARTPEVIRKAFGKGPEQIENGQDVTEYYNQKRFFLSKGDAIRQGILEGNYSITLKETDLPWYCPIVDGEIDISRKELPRAVYVRVIPVSNRVNEDNFRRARWKPQAWTNNESTPVHIDPIQLTRPSDVLGDNDLGTPSEVIEVLIPTGQQNLYARALQTAIAIVTLSRSDLSPPNPVAGNEPTPNDSTYRETGLEYLAVEINRRMRVDNPENFYGQVSSTQSPQSFVGDLYQRVVTLADEYLRTQGALPQSVLQALEPTFDSLVNWKWSDTETPVANGNRALRFTILQSLWSSNVNTPLSRNRRVTRRYYSSPNGTPAEVLSQLDLKWREGTFGVVYHPTSKDSSPVIGPTNGAQPQYWYARDLIPEDIYQKARSVLSLTSSRDVSRSRTGDWISQRVFSPRQPTGLALTLLNKTEGFFNTLLAGTQNVADGILRVIEFLEQRVREIQELIRRLDQLLDIPFQISFPSAKILLLITNGTNGLVTGLLSAQEKPQEGPKGYAGGGILVAGSAPSILIDLLSKGIQSASGG